MNILLNWIQLISKFWIEFWIEFTIQKLFWIIFWIEFCRNIYIEFFVELNLDEAYENESYIESIFWIFNWKGPFLVYFGTFWALFWFNQYQWFPDYWIELSIELNQQNLFWIESWLKQYCLNWILVKSILNRILNESFFGKIQTLNWIR